MTGTERTTDGRNDVTVAKDGRNDVTVAIDLRKGGDVAIDLRDASVDGEALFAAIQDRPSPYTVACPDPTPVHERVGFVRSGMGLQPRTALAAAARTRGIDTVHDERIDRLATELDRVRDSIEDDTPTSASGVATTPSPADGPESAAITRLRERVAELRGRVAALESLDADPTDARAALRETAARLSERQTRRIAADQTRERLRAHRDHRERCLSLEDRLANARRDARAELVAAVRAAYAGAVARLCEPPDDPFAVPAPVAALAVLHVARVRAPVVLALDHPARSDGARGPGATPRSDRPEQSGDDRSPPSISAEFADPERAAAWLDAPVIGL